MKGKQIIFIIVGLFLIAGNQIASYYFEIPDFLDGLIFGSGIGLMIFGFTKKKKQ